MTEQEVTKTYELVTMTDLGAGPCPLCDAKELCDAEAERNEGPNWYFRACHDEGYLKRRPTPAAEAADPLRDVLIDVIAEYTREVKGTKTLSEAERVQCELLVKDVLAAVLVDRIAVELAPYLDKYIGEDS